MNPSSKNDDWSDTDDEALARIDEKDFTVGNFEGTTKKYQLECDNILRERWKSSEKSWHRYIVVSDFAKQHWCEQQHLYSLAEDIYEMRAPEGEKVDLEDTEEVKKVKAKGTEIHKAKELEIGDQVEVKIETIEDKWAVRLINLKVAVVGFLCGQKVAREVPVFGSLFGIDTFLFGIIDEVRYDPELHRVTISELKTRNSKYPPKKSQQEKDKYQVSLYAQLFNEMVKGSVTLSSVASHFKVDLQRPLSEEVSSHVKATVRSGGQMEEVVTLDELLKDVLLQIQALTVISWAQVEYIHQDSQELIFVNQFDIDDQLLQVPALV